MPTEDTNMNEAAPMDFNAAIATQEPWLQAWIMLLVITNLLAVLFVVSKQESGFKVRPEALAILLSFVAAAVFMTWLYNQYGYVRLLGIAHLVFWLPVYVWVLNKYRNSDYSGWFQRYITLYLVIAGISLVVDFIDVVRYFLGQA